jgi:hypothetical protein
MHVLYKKCTHKKKQVRVEGTQEDHSIENISFFITNIYFGLFSGPKPPAFSDENLRFVKEIRNFQHDSPSCFFWEEAKFLQ